jgi:hypothetical protein
MNNEKIINPNLQQVETASSNFLCKFITRLKEKRDTARQQQIITLQTEIQNYLKTQGMDLRSLIEHPEIDQRQKAAIVSYINFAAELNIVTEKQAIEIRTTLFSCTPGIQGKRRKYSFVCIVGFERFVRFYDETKEGLIK